jgi:hypothetical protein
MEYKPLLGDAGKSEIKTTRLGIRYDAQGFDRVRRNKLERAISRLQLNGVPQYVINPFLQYAHKLGEPDYVPRSLDRIFLITKNRFLACGLAKADKAAQLARPKDLLIRVEPGLFTMTRKGQEFTAKGAAVDKRLIRAAVYVIHPVNERAEFWNLEAIVEWEMGNWFGLLVDYNPWVRFTGKEAEKREIGNRSPCALLRAA